MPLKYALEGSKGMTKIIASKNLSHVLFTWFWDVLYGQVTY
jgi:hypothetical protein